jgi:hypothetical protein
MVSINKGIRTIARFFGKVVLLLFALFCVTTGLVSEVSSATLNGTVRNRANLSPIADIEIIMSELMCPLYGIGLPCIAGRALDTAISNSGGVFQVQASSGNSFYFSLTDPYADLPGRFLPRTCTGYSSGSSVGILYMMPKSGSYTVNGKVLAQQDSIPIKGIKAELYQVTAIYTCCSFTPTFYSETVVGSAFADQSGQFSFSVDTILSTAFIKVTDVDSTENGGTFGVTKSANFNAFNDASTVSVYMNKQSTSISGIVANHAEPRMFFHYVNKGILEFSVPGLWSSAQPGATVVDSRGAVIARPELSGSGIVRWNTAGVPSGVYFLRIPLAQGMGTYRVLVP